MVCSAGVEYKVPGERKFRVTTRPIHNLNLVVPIEELPFEERLGQWKMIMKKSATPSAKLNLP
jgi:hypothetical protein